MKIILTEQQIIKMLSEQISPEQNPFADIGSKVDELAPNLSKFLNLMKPGSFTQKSDSTLAPVTSTPDNQSDNSRFKIIPDAEKSVEMMHPLGQKVNVTSHFGYRDSNVGTKNHKGIDFSASSGSRVYAPKDGTVLDAKDTTPNRCGGFVRIEHENYITKYCHLSKIDVRAGDKVKRGQVIAYTGGGSNDPMKGVSTGPHLHYEIIDKKSRMALNPVTVQKNLV